MATWSNINTGLTGNALIDLHGGKVFNAAKNTLIKCTPGAIYKTENTGVSWANITPGTDPVGSAASAVDYVWYAPDITDTTKHYYLARNNIGGTWSSWILKHNSGTSAYSWTTISGGGAASLGTSPINIYTQASPQSIAAPSQGAFPYLSLGAGGGMPRNLTKASENVFTHITLFQSETGVDWNGTEVKVVILNRTGTSLNSSCAVNVPMPNSLEDQSDPRIAHLSTNRCAMVYGSYDRPASFQANYVCVGEFYSTGSANFGTPVRLDGTENRLEAKDIVNIDPNRLFSVYSRHSSSDLGLLYRRIETVGRGITLGNEYNALQTSMLAYHPIAVTIDASTVVVLVSQTEGGGLTTASPGGFVVDIQGSSAVNSEWVPIPGLNPGDYITEGAASKIATNKFVYVFNCNSNGACAITCDVISSASLDWGTPNSIDNVRGGTYSIDTFGEDNRFALIRDDDPSNGWGIYMSIADVTGASIDFGSWTLASEIEQPFAVNVRYDTGGVFINTYNAIIAIEEDKALLWEFESSGGGGGGKALNMSLGGLGGTLYSAFSDDTNLNLNVYDTSDMSLTRTVDMGVGSINDTVSKIRLAYTETINGTDDFCYVYGRMLNPGGLSASMNHIIKTEDAGVTFSNVENTWGRDHCGAMARRSWATPVVIRNIGNSIGGFYVGGSGLTLRSLLPFPVSPGGLYVTNNGFVIAGASTAETWPIRYTIWPYQRWAMLKGYPTDGGVTGITVL